MVAVAFFDSDDLAGHVDIIRRQTQRSLEDPEVHVLARKIAEGRPDLYIKGIPAVHFRGLPYQLAVSREELAPARNELEQINAVWDFMVLNVTYMFDPPGIDMFSTVPVLLDAGTGDCDDAVVFFGALLGALGFRVKARVISTGDEAWEHIYPLVGLPRARPARWLALDWTVQGARPGWEYDNARHQADFEIA